MKKFLFYIIVSLSVVCTLDSCKKEKNPAPKPQSSEISVRQPSRRPTLLKAENFQSDTP